MPDPQIKIRKAEGSDCRYYWEVNNQPAVRAQSISTDAIPFGDHEKWFNSSLMRSDRKMFIAECDEREIGVVRFDLGLAAYAGRMSGEREASSASIKNHEAPAPSKNVEATISLALATHATGRGLGTKVIARASQTFLKSYKEVQAIIAFVKTDNEASKKAFLNAGFAFVGEESQSGLKLFKYILRR